MTYADTVRRRAEIRAKLGDQRLTAIMGREMDRRRIEACANHLAMRCRCMRYTPWLLVDGRRI